MPLKGGKKKERKVECFKSAWNLLDSLNYGYSSSVGLLFGLLELAVQGSQ